MKRKTSGRLVLLLTAALLSSCLRIESAGVEEQVGCRGDCAVPDLSGIDASSRGSRLFVNFGGAVATKSSSPFEPLESLLSRDETKILDIGEYILTEIPFKECYSEDEVNMVSYRPDAFLEDSLSVAKVSLVDWFHPDTEEHSMFVITMIPSADYDSEGQNADYSFIEGLSDFSGAILFSELDGTFISGFRYDCGQVDDLVAYDSASMPGERVSGQRHWMYIFFPEEGVVQTKAMDRMRKLEDDDYLCLDDLDPSVCVGKRDNSDEGCGGGTSNPGSSRGSEASDLIRYAGDYGSSNYTGGGGGGGSRNSNSNNSDVDKNKKATSCVDSLSTKIVAAKDEARIIQKELMDGKELELVEMLYSELAPYVDKITSIEVKDSVFINGSSVGGKTVPHKDGTYSIEIRREKNPPPVISMAPFYEELLHVVQYCEEDRSWTSGDMEFEAKVYLSLLYIKYGLFWGKDVDEIKAFKKYYSKPSDKTFNDAMSSGWWILAYNREDYPLTIGREPAERIKHIKF